MKGYDLNLRGRAGLGFDGGGMFSRAEEERGKAGREQHSLLSPFVSFPFPSCGSEDQGDVSILKTFSLEVVEVKAFWLVSCDWLKVELPAPSTSQNRGSLFPRKGSERAEVCPGLPPGLYFRPSPPKQRANVLRMSRQHGRVWVPRTFRKASSAGGPPRQCAVCCTTRKRKARLLSPAPPHQFLDILWHLNRLLLLWGRVTCTVTFVLIPSWWPPSVYQSTKRKWNYSRTFKASGC